MTPVEALVDAWEMAMWQFMLVFKGLRDEDLWVRPHPDLLSIGEIVCHVGLDEIQSMQEPALRHESDYATWPIQSPFLNRALYYYDKNLAEPVVLALSVEEVKAELQRVHDEAKKVVLRKPRDLSDIIEGSDGTWGGQLNYRIFHLAYHAGQAYSLRHMMGHDTANN